MLVSQIDLIYSTTAKSFLGIKPATFRLHCHTTTSLPAALDIISAFQHFSTGAAHLNNSNCSIYTPAFKLTCDLFGRTHAVVMGGIRHDGAVLQYPFCRRAALGRCGGPDMYPKGGDKALVCTVTHGSGRRQAERPHAPGRRAER